MVTVVPCPAPSPVREDFALVLHSEEMTRDRKTEAEAAVSTRGAAVGLPEAIEDVGRNSGSMPTPESRTSISIASPLQRSRFRTRPPSGVNLMAFEIHIART